MSLKKQQPFPNGQAGFTLLELMVVVAIIGIMATIATANLIDLVPRHHVKSATRQLRVELQKAKMEAVKRNQPCLISFTEANGSDGFFRACFNSANDVCTDAGDEIFAEINMADYPHARIDSASFSGGVSYFRFNTRGMPGLGGAITSGTITIGNSSDPNYSLSIALATSGRVQIN